MCSSTMEDKVKDTAEKVSDQKKKREVRKREFGVDLHLCGDKIPPWKMLMEKCGSGEI